MFASQLLRILEAIPSDPNAHDPAKQDMTMKESQYTNFHDSVGRETDPLASGSQEVYQLNGPRRDSHPSGLEVNDRDECRNADFVDDFSMNTENGTRDSRKKEEQNGFWYYPSFLEQDTDSLSSDTNAKDKMHSNLGRESLMKIEEFTYGKRSDYRDSQLLYVTASDLSGTRTNLYTDKNVLECEPPELVVCYEEINHSIVKDICIDKGMPVQGKFLIKSTKDDQSGHSFPQPLNGDNHYVATEGGDVDHMLSGGLAASSLVKTEGVCANKHASKEESNGKLLSQENNKSPLQGSFAKDTTKHHDLEDSMQKGETKFGVTGKTVTNASEEDSYIDKTLPIQEFGTRSFLRSFLNSLDGEGNKITPPPDETSSRKAVSDGPAASSAEAGPKKNVQASSLPYNCEVESGSIIFNFNLLTPAAASVTNGRTIHVKDWTVNSVDVPDHKDTVARQVHYDSSQDSSIGEGHEPSLNIMDGFSKDFSTTGKAWSVSSEDMGDENVHNQSPDYKEENSDRLSSDDHLQFSGSRSINSINMNGQVFESHILEHVNKDSTNDSVACQGNYDVGELSFSAPSLVAYSAPIAFSGNLSFGSDGSATSGGSFAFPILDPECRPVRTTKADRRHFQKHKFWRSGLLCCRF